jgi:protein ImuB
MKGFEVDGNADLRERQEAGMGPRMGLRRLRPTVPVRMWMQGGEPSAFATRQKRFEVMAAFGPWRTNGSWWTTDAWDLEEWDVLCLQPDGSTLACLMARDCVRNEWRLEAMYD